MPRQSGKKTSRKKQTRHKELMTGVAFGIFLLALFVLDLLTDTTPTGAVIAEVEQAEPQITSAIVSPPSGSLQNGDFTVTVQTPANARQCYYSIHDNGALTYDRRVRDCGGATVIRSEWCQTSGEKTCLFTYEVPHDGVTDVLTAEYSRP